MVLLLQVAHGSDKDLGHRELPQECAPLLALLGPSLVSAPATWIEAVGSDRVAPTVRGWRFHEEGFYSALVHHPAGTCPAVTLHLVGAPAGVEL